MRISTQQRRAHIREMVIAYVKQSIKMAVALDSFKRGIFVREPSIPWRTQMSL